MIKKILHKIHKWVGLIAIIPLTIIAITGIILVIFEVSKNNSHHEIFLKQQDLTTLQNTINDFAKQNFNKNIQNFSINFYNKQGLDARVRFTLEGETSRRAFYMDRTLNLTPLIQNPAREFAINIHDMRFLPSGRNVTGIIGIVSLIITLVGIGLYFYQKKLDFKQAFILQNSAWFYKNFHVFFGLIFSVFFIIIILSGIFIAFPLKSFEFSVKKDTLNIDINSLLETYYIEDADFKKNEITLTLKTENEILPIIAKVLENKIILQNPKNYTFIEKIYFIQTFLHKSKIGILWAFIQIITGSFLVIISITGFLLWYKKKQNRINRS